jgi:hypothetical protein
MKEQKQKTIDEGKIREPKTWKKIDSPNFFKFENIGDSISGILLNKDTSSRYGFGLYTILTFNKEQKRFHGSSQLDDLMMNIPEQSYIQIEYVDNQETSNGTMKLFEVNVGEN